MKLEISDGLIRGVPLAVLGAVLLHGAVAVWWVSGKAKDADYLEKKVLALEDGFARGNETQARMLERLVRIEERTQAQTLILERIDKQMMALR